MPLLLLLDPCDGYPVSHYPIFTDQIALASKPFDDPQVWTTIDPSKVKQRSWTRGRQSEHDRPETGTSETIIGDETRDFDSENTASPHYPNVKPMRRIRSTAVMGETTYNLFETFIDPEQGWEREDTVGIAEVTVPANDAFALLDARKLTDDDYPQQTAGERIGALLDTYGWPAGQRNIDTTTQQSDIQAAAAGDLDGTSVLDAILAAADNDNGIFYINGSGEAVYRGRHQQDNSRYSTSQATFADTHNWQDGYFLYETAPPSTSRIVNDYQITRAGGTMQPARDQTSIDEYGQRSLPVATLHISDAEALAYGQWRLAQDKDPHRRYDELTIRPMNDTELWAFVLGCDLGDRITLITTPQGQGDPITLDLRIEGIKVTVGPGMDSSCVLRLSPVSDTIGWALGDPVYSVLGQTTALTY